MFRRKILDIRYWIDFGEMRARGGGLYSLTFSHSRKSKQPSLRAHEDIENKTAE